MQERILIIGEVEEEAGAYADALAQDFTLSLAPSILDAGKRLQKETFALILFDLRDAHTEIGGVIGTLHQLSPYTPVIVVSRVPDSGQIVTAVKAGAADFITNPFAPGKLRHSVRHSPRHSRDWSDS